METGTITVLDGSPILFEVDGTMVMSRQEVENVPLTELLADLELDGWTVQGEMPQDTQGGRYTIPMVKEQSS